jgi:serine/threonine-protein kinase
MGVLDRIKIVEKIGQGGMAIVYRGYLNGSYGFKKEIVIKKILKEHFDNERYLDMFVDEASISAKLTHSNIVQVFDFFEEENELHIIMEYVNGGTLRDLMTVHKERDIFIPIEHVLFIINNILTGMDFYHNKRDTDGKHLGIIHRDLTPKNILISIYGEVKISDFGIAKFEDKKDLTTFGEVKGKPSYMSPEQIKLLPNLDNRVDLFALGVIFYELLTNKHPFREGNIYQTQQKIINGDYTPISEMRNDLSEDILNIVYKLLETDRDERYMSASMVKKRFIKFR